MAREEPSIGYSGHRGNPGWTKTSTLAGTLGVRGTTVPLNGGKTGHYSLLPYRVQSCVGLWLRSAGVCMVPLLSEPPAQCPRCRSLGSPENRPSTMMGAAGM